MEKLRPLIMVFTIVDRWYMVNGCALYVQNYMYVKTLCLKEIFFSFIGGEMTCDSMIIMHHAHHIPNKMYDDSVVRIRSCLR